MWLYNLPQSPHMCCFLTHIARSLLIRCVRKAPPPDCVHIVHATHLTKSSGIIHHIPYHAFRTTSVMDPSPAARIRARALICGTERSCAKRPKNHTTNPMQALNPETAQPRTFFYRKPLSHLNAAYRTARCTNIQWSRNSAVISHSCSALSAMASLSSAASSS